MNDEDTAPPPSQRMAPRHLPVLTEVVGEQEDAATPLARQQPADMLGAQELLQQLGPDLDKRIAEAMGRVLHEQLLGLNARVQKAVAEVVREAVASAVARSAHGSTDPGNSSPS